MIRFPSQELKKLWKQSKLVILLHIAKRFGKRVVEFMDLIEEGNLGFMKAVEKFDESKEVAFSTYRLILIYNYERALVA